MRKFQSTSRYIEAFLERSLSSATYIFSFMSIIYYFSSSLCYSSDDMNLRMMNVKFFYPLTLFYGEHVYLIFSLMVGIFFICSRNLLPFTKFIRFNVLQAILLSILCTCISQIYMAAPTAIRLSTSGLIFSKFAFFGATSFIIYSIFIIWLGRFPVLPIVSKAANIYLKRYK
jgi:hypothetical protein